VTTPPSGAQRSGPAQSGSAWRRLPATQPLRALVVLGAYAAAVAVITAGLLTVAATPTALLLTTGWALLCTVPVAVLLPTPRPREEPVHDAQPVLLRSAQPAKAVRQAPESTGQPVSGRHPPTSDRAKRGDLGLRGWVHRAVPDASQARPGRFATVSERRSGRSRGQPASRRSRVQLGRGSGWMSMSQAAGTGALRAHTTAALTIRGVGHRDHAPLAAVPARAGPPRGHARPRGTRHRARRRWGRCARRAGRRDPARPVPVRSTLRGPTTAGRPPRRRPAACTAVRVT